MTTNMVRAYCANGHLLFIDSHRRPTCECIDHNDFPPSWSDLDPEGGRFVIDVTTDAIFVVGLTNERH